MLSVVTLLSAILAHPALSETINVDSENSSNLSLDQQIQLIDAEIILLKAELAQKNSEIEQVRQYLIKLEEVESFPLSEDMQLRIRQLRSYLEIADSTVKNKDSKSEHFYLDTKQIIILLPLSGHYEKVGKQVLAGLMEQFSDYHPVVIDTYIYDSMFDLWELVKLYNPTLIIGPLERDKAQALNDLNTGVPTLYLNEVDSPKPTQASFSLSRSFHVYDLAKLISENGYKHVVFLTDDSSQSQKNLANFYKAWAYLEEKNANEYLDEIIEEKPYFQEQPIDTNVDKAISDLLLIERSNGRKNWLQKKTGTRIYFEPRARQDIELIVSFLPYRKAMQVTPLLEFFHLYKVSHYWLPSKLPSGKNFQNNLPFWHSTQALLPAYYAQPVFNANVMSNKTLPEQNEQSGIFHAFGVLAAKVVIQLTNLERMPIESDLGRVDFFANQFPYLAPDLYWLNKGSFSLNQ